jgi:hypothetical protein
MRSAWSARRWSIARWSSIKPGRYRLDGMFSVHFSPADAREEMLAWLKPHLPPDTRFVPQCDGDLGERLALAVRAEFQRGAERVFLVGGDCPAIGPDYFTDADGHLNEADLVIGPATDGGYVLLGIKKEHTELFQGVSPAAHPPCSNRRLQTRHARASLPNFCHLWRTSTTLQVCRGSPDSCRFLGSENLHLDFHRHGLGCERLKSTAAPPLGSTPSYSSPFRAAWPVYRSGSERGSRRTTSEALGNFSLQLFWRR